MKTNQLKIEYCETSALRPYERNARKHSKKQIRQIADQIEASGFNSVIAVTADREIICGHARWAAAKLLGMDKVPTVCLAHLSDEERRAYVLADNKLALNSTWDKELLGLELSELGELGFDLTMTGFSPAEIDFAIDEANQSDPDLDDGPEDRVPPIEESAVTQQGDVWVLGRHLLMCGDARKLEDQALLMDSQKADLIFTDPPYGCAVNGHISGLGKIKHREFIVGSGISQKELLELLTASLSAAAAQCRDGAIAFVFMDFRGAATMLAAGEVAFTEYKQLCVWNKTNAGMGTFYRNKHELVFVYKVGTAPHTNTFGLGETGRYRTNVWEYPGISSLGPDRAEEHSRHPTPKPVALVADAIRDCTLRGEVVLDPFAGSGSTMIAAEITGRYARLLELDPLYCDVIIRRFEEFSGKTAVLQGSLRSFEDVAAERLGEIKGAA